MKKIFVSVQLNICYFDEVDIITFSWDPNEGPIVGVGFYDNGFDNN